MARHHARIGRFHPRHRSERSFANSVHGNLRDAVRSHHFRCLRAYLLRVTRISEASLPLDGLLVALHGAAGSERYQGCRRRISAAVEKSCWPGSPGRRYARPSRECLSADGEIQHRSDFLSNKSAYRSGRKRTRSSLPFSAILLGRVTPVQALETPPLLIEICKQHTTNSRRRVSTTTWKSPCLEGHSVCQHNDGLSIFGCSRDGSCLYRNSRPRCGPRTTGGTLDGRSGLGASTLFRRQSSVPESAVGAAKNRPGSQSF